MASLLVMTLVVYALLFRFVHCLVLIAKGQVTFKTTFFHIGVNKFIISNNNGLKSEVSSLAATKCQSNVANSG